MSTERPILFSGPMVRAILDGTKTQTRRVVKMPIWLDNEYPNPAAPHLYGRFATPRPCPYGKPGDLLWVRETWNGNEEGLAYRATDPDMDGLPWRPSIHMPRWASRITLEITGIRVERLQEIGWEDALAEGIEEAADYDPEGNRYIDGNSMIDEFSGLWDDINTKHGHSWESNPWVWVIEFRRVEP